ncbi:MAG: thiamine pyrophosphate-dependent dehydrogenase E1 component subunit alpha [Actinomycetota bacterium]
MIAAEPGLLLEPLLRARRFDELLVASAREIRGHYHVSIGLESTAAALAVHRRAGDMVTTTYRNHAHLAALGSDLAVMFAEVLGRDLGPQRGRAGSTHLADPELGILHTSAMVSGGVSQALGLAYAGARREADSVCFCFFGDGAFGEGPVHESLNLARLWELPVVFVCENNAAPEHGRANAYQSAASLLAIAEVHGVAGEAVDARQPAATAEALGRLTYFVRAGGGPRFLEARAAQWEGSTTFFPHDATGRTDVHDAVRPCGDSWRDHDDPVLNECRRLLGAGVAVETLVSLDERVSAAVEEALAAGRQAPVAPPEAALRDVIGSP